MGLCKDLSKCPGEFLQKFLQMFRKTPHIWMSPSKVAGNSLRSQILAQNIHITAMEDRL